MALGGWLAGIIYDWAGFYAITFATGIAFNAAHILVIGSLVLRGGPASRRARSPTPLRAATIPLVLCQPCSDVFRADLLPRGMAVGGGGGEAVPGDVDGGGA